MQYSLASTSTSRPKVIMTDDRQIGKTSSGAFRGGLGSIRQAIMSPPRHTGLPIHGLPGTQVGPRARSAGTIPPAGAGAELPLNDDKKRLGVAGGTCLAGTAAKLWQ
ncbi:MAG: hypothetical protein ABL878_06125 [Burkholderiales bacterium]